MDPSPAAVVAAAKVQGVADVVAEAAGQFAMAEAEVESVAAVEQTVASGSWHDRAAKETEPEAVAKEWPGAKEASDHKQLERASSGIAEVVAVDSVASVPGFGRLRGYCSGRSGVVKFLSFQSETGSGFEGVWWVVQSSQIGSVWLQGSVEECPVRLST